MTYRFLDPGIRVALDRISDYADTCWTSLRPTREREAAFGGGSFPHSGFVLRGAQLLFHAAPHPPTIEGSPPRPMDLRAYPPAHSRLRTRPFHADAAGSSGHAKARMMVVVQSQLQHDIDQLTPDHPMVEASILALTASIERLENLPHPRRNPELVKRTAPASRRFQVVSRWCL